MPSPVPFPRKKVAIIGGGVGGIGALWALNRTHHDVYIYEATDRLGGYTNTVQWRRGKYSTSVDTGFIAFNTATYPNFLNFLKALKVQTERTKMTFGVSRDEGLLEWAGTSLSGIFAQRRNIFSPRMWRMIFDIVRFNHFSLDLLRAEERSLVYVNGNGLHQSEKQETIAEYLEREGYSDAFRDDYLIPMTAAVWSTSPIECPLDIPATTLVRFMWNQGLLSTLTVSSDWVTLKQGSKAYVDVVTRGFPPNHIFLKTPVKSLTNDDNGKVVVQLENGRTDVYDHVIVATHGDQARALISPEADYEERDILAGFQTKQNIVILHSDTSLMPKSRDSWSSCNYITKSSILSSDIDQVCLTYNMNILQNIPVQIFGHVLVTINPPHLPPPELVQGRYTHSYPLYDSAAIRSQSLLHRIQNTRGISYCGTWTKYGTHEDAFSSGLKVAQDHLGAKLPFKFKDSTSSKGRRPVLGLTDLLLRLVIMIIQLFMIVIEKMLGIQRGLQQKAYHKGRILSKKLTGINGLH